MILALNGKLQLIWVLIFTAGLGNLLHAQDPFFQFPEPETEFVSPDLMTGEENIIYIQDRWQFMAGDSLAWAAPDYDDSHWDFISTNLTQADLSFIEWEGMGWFRKKLEVAPELRGKPVALLIDRHLGASEIYLNGIKIHELGAFSVNPAEVKTYNRENPLVIVFPDQEEHLLAVRFINPDVTETGRLVGYNGFRFLLGDWDTHQSNRFAFIAHWTSYNMFYIGALLAFAVIHFLLFVFYPVEKKNLYFSLFVTFLAILSYLFYKNEISGDTFGAIYFIRFTLIAEVIVLAFAARFTHSIHKDFTPVYANAMVALGVAAAAVIWFFPIDSIWMKELLVLIFVLEILRTVFVMLYHNMKRVWVLGFGVVMFVLGLFYSILVNFELIQGEVQTGNMIGAGFLVLSMSVYLSREFASTQKNLEQKLSEVQMLSKRSLQQEKINKEREIEKRLLEAENNRKSKELEEARALQLSMLPKHMPALPGFDISVFMETATEVGGDYYDYSLDKNGSLVLVIGDATGHGMKSGIMVAAAKSYFHTLVHEHDGLGMLSRISSGLRNLDMKMMYMGLMLVHFDDRNVEISTAGMPPALHFRSCDNSINRITLKGLPLGSKVNYPYEKYSFVMNDGDVLLIMSDGLTELFNQKREMLDLPRIEEALKNSAEYSAGDIIAGFTRLIETWSGGTDPHDDITLMVIKKTKVEK